jgi:hypothetical protein
LARDERLLENVQQEYDAEWAKFPVDDLDDEDDPDAE